MFIDKIYVFGSYILSTLRMKVVISAKLEIMSV